MDLNDVKEYLALAGSVITVASLISSTFGLSKKKGWVGQVGKLIDGLALNFGHKATPQDPEAK